MLIIVVLSTFFIETCFFMCPRKSLLGNDKLDACFAELRASRRQNNSQTATRRQNSRTVDDCICFYFIKYCKEMPGEIRDLISSHEY